jgi:hypothetical protein
MLSGRISTSTILDRGRRPSGASHLLQTRHRHRRHLAQSLSTAANAYFRHTRRGRRAMGCGQTRAVCLFFRRAPCASLKTPASRLDLTVPALARRTMGKRCLLVEEAWLLILGRPPYRPVTLQVDGFPDVLRVAQRHLRREFERPVRRCGHSPAPICKLRRERPGRAGLSSTSRPEQHDRGRRDDYARIARARPLH